MSTTVPPNFNYAAAIGIHSLPGAIVFTVLYVLLLAFFAHKSFTHPTYVHFVLTFFCISKYLKKVSEINICWLPFSTNHRVYHTRRFSRFGKGGRDTWIGYCRSDSFWCWLLWASLFRVHSGLGSVSPLFPQDLQVRPIWLLLFPASKYTALRFKSSQSSHFKIHSR